MEGRNRQPGQRNRRIPGSSSSSRTESTKSSEYASTGEYVAPAIRGAPRSDSDWRLRRRGASSIRNEQNLQQQEEDKQSSSCQAVIGVCPLMCPEAEREQRERLRDLAVFERLYGNPGRSSPSLAVKKFCRTISTRHVQESNVRPLPVLEDTLSYLLNLLDSTDHPFEMVHDFVFDRTRSIRQDLSMQSITNDKAIDMYEKMVKFHVLSHFKLRRCNSCSNLSSMLHLNMEQLVKVLGTLYNLYDANRGSTCIFEKEAEFRSLHVLLHLDSRNQRLEDSLSLWFQHVPRPIIKSKELCFARNILRSFRMGNYKCFLFTVGAGASNLQYCIIEPYINKVRALSLLYINNAGYKIQPYPLTYISKILMMEESDLELFCNACGLETCTDEMGNKLLPTKQTTFCYPKEEFQSYKFLGLEQFEV